MPEKIKDMRPVWSEVFLRGFSPERQQEIQNLPAWGPLLEAWSKFPLGFAISEGKSEKIEQAIAQLRAVFEKLSPAERMLVLKNIGKFCADLKAYEIPKTFIDPLCTMLSDLYRAELTPIIIGKLPGIGSGDPREQTLRQQYLQGIERNFSGFLGSLSHLFFAKTDNERSTERSSVVNTLGQMIYDLCIMPPEGQNTREERFKTIMPGILQWFNEQGFSELGTSVLLSRRVRELTQSMQPQDLVQPVPKVPPQSQPVPGVSHQRWEGVKKAGQMIVRGFKAIWEGAGRLLAARRPPSSTGASLAGQLGGGSGVNQAKTVSSDEKVAVGGNTPSKPGVPKTEPSAPGDTTTEKTTSSPPSGPAVGRGV